MQVRTLCIFVSLSLPWVLEACGGDASTSETVSVDAETIVTLQRQPCFGSCPIYSLSIGGDGTVSYMGAGNVRVFGAASAQIPVDAVQALVDEMLRADYFHLSVPDICPEGIAEDEPGAKTSLSLGDRFNTVEDVYGNPCAPKVLTVLEGRIDEVAGSE